MGFGEPSPASSERAEIIGTIDRIQSFGEWAVAFLRDDGFGSPKLPRIVGPRVANGNLVKGTCYRFFGRRIEHPKYGSQIEAERITEYVAATDGSGLARYMSRTVNGVGDSTAEKIVEWYQHQGPGLNVLRQHIEDAPEKIAEIPFLTDRVRQGLMEKAGQGAENTARAAFGARLAGAGPIPAPVIEALVIEHVSGALKAGVPGHLVPGRAWADYAANPYAKVGSLRGYGFRIADMAGRHIGFPLDDKRRLLALGGYALATGCEGYGHVYLTESQLSEFIRGADPSARIRDVLDVIKGTAVASVDQGRWYPPRQLRDECNVAQRLTDMLAGEPLAPGATADLAGSEAASALHISDEQRQALAGILSARSRVHTLTAGPGCGKTAVVEVLALALLKHGFRASDIAFCAPTGKAAKVLTARLQKYRRFADATTVHRLLGASPLGFTRNEGDPLTERLIVVDEFSMVDLGLMAGLLAAVAEGTHILLIGDPGQLPSVGAGSVLSDVLRLPADHHRLTKVFRNSGTLLDYIHSIGRGEPVSRPDAQDVIQRGDPGDDEAAFEQVVKTHLLALERQRKLAPNENPLGRVLLLCPRRKGKRDEPGWNITYLNAVLQQRLNPDGEKIPGSFFRDGDRVILRENALLPDQTNVEVPVFNGDTGFIHPGYIQLDSGETVLPPKTYLRDSVQLAYALTVHVSQGSEYPEVILVQKDGSPVLCNRELLYTAASRAKSKLTVFGDPRLIFKACGRRASRRNSALVARVAHELDQADASAAYAVENLT